MKKTKLFAKFFMIILSAILVMAGCSSKESNTSNGDSKEAPYELTMAYLSFANIDDLPSVQEEINKITKKKINATVKLMPIGPAAWQQQSNLMLTGNEKLDLIVATASGGFLTQAAKGQFIALDDLLKTHGQDILSVVPKHLLEGGKVKGEIYGVPSMRDFGMNYGFGMRKDIVDKYQIDLSKVKTFADLGEVFKIIKENEPTLIPVVNAKSVANPVTVLTGGKFDQLGDFLGVMSFKDKKVINMFEDPDYIQALELVREWYEAGYIAKDAATSTDTPESMIKANKAFGFFNRMKPGYEVQEQSMTGYEMVTVKLTDVYSYTDAAIGINMSIPRNSQNPEKAMELMNLLYSDKDIMNLLANGIEGKHYQVNSDGTVSLPDGVKESKYVFNQWEIGNNYLTYPWEGNSPELWEEMKKFNDSANLSPAFGFQFNPDPVKTEIAASTNVLNQYKDGLETGTLDPDKSLPEFNKKLKAAGLDKIIAEKQSQFDKWTKEK
jgi:putative aldouronate transport system substrate-binding protein